jgi:hypothetical protein
MKGILKKVINNDGNPLWIVAYKTTNSDGSIYSKTYVVYPGTVINDDMDGKEVEFEIVDGYAKLIN